MQPVILSTLGGASLRVRRVRLFKPLFCLPFAFTIRFFDYNRFESTNRSLIIDMTCIGTRWQCRSCGWNGTGQGRVGASLWKEAVVREYKLNVLSWHYIHFTLKDWWTSVIKCSYETQEVSIIERRCTFEVRGKKETLLFWILFHTRYLGNKRLALFKNY